MSPYLTPAKPPAASGYVARFATHIYGDLVIHYVEHRWLWVLRLKAWWFMLNGNGYELVMFRRLDGSDYTANDRALAARCGDRVRIVD